MRLRDVPKRKGALLSERITIPVTPEMKARLLELREVYGRDHLAFIRSLLADALRQIFSEPDEDGPNSKDEKDERP